MKKIKIYNQIAQAGLSLLKDYEVRADVQNEEGILVRSANLYELDYPQTLAAIARAGAGVNNIDIEECTKRGIAVFNTPGANSNAVKELVFAGLLMASRDIYHGIEWVKANVDDPNLAKTVEKQKKRYAGHELMKKSLGVIGCGAIGIQVANLALRFGMDVHGYDPYLSVDAAWNLSRYVKHEKQIEGIFSQCDFITLHVPENEQTKNLINKDSLAKMKHGVKILNFARGGLVDEQDLLEGLESGQVACYVTDFPTPALASHPHVIALPHLGASTQESEENCACFAAKELKDYLEYGNVQNAINLPNTSLDICFCVRLTCIHKNIPKMISQITDVLSREEINIENLLNKSKNDIAYTMIDLDRAISLETLDSIQAIPEMIRVRLLKGDLA